MSHPTPGTGEAIGIVYLDRNTNGVFDVADSPLVGVSVAITDTNGSTTIVVTDPSGFYNLTVDAGLTVVNVLTNDPAFPTGSTVTVGTTNPTTLNVPDGGAARDDNGFRLLPGNGLISGVIYIDNNNNGLYEIGVDTPIPNISINITDTNGVVHPEVTDANGFYSVVVTNGITVVDVVTSDPDFPADLGLTTNSQGEGSDPTAVLVPNGGAATDNTGYSQLNRGPVAVNDNAITPEDVPVNVPVLVNDSDPDNDPLTIVSVVTTNGTAVINGTNVLYTPSTNFFGTNVMVYTISDGSVTNSAFITVVVNPVNDAPIAFSQSLTNAEDTALPITLTGFDVDGPVMNFVVSTQPLHGTLTGSGANLTYTQQQLRRPRQLHLHGE